MCAALYAGAGQESLLVGVSRLLIGRGTPVYNSTDWAELEHSGVVNTSSLAESYLAKHPDIAQALQGVQDGEEYSVLPYKTNQYDNAIRMLQEEMAREYAGQQVRGRAGGQEFVK